MQDRPFLCTSLLLLKSTPAIHTLFLLSLRWTQPYPKIDMHIPFALISQILLIEDKSTPILLSHDRCCFLRKGPSLSIYDQNLVVEEFGFPLPYDPFNLVQEAYRGQQSLAMSKKSYCSHCSRRFELQALLQLEDLEQEVEAIISISKRSRVKHYVRTC